MSAHEKELHPDEKVKLGAAGSKIVAGGLFLGLGGLVLCVILGLTIGDDMRRWFHSYLLGLAFALTFPIGGLFFVMLQHLVKAQWSVTVRRTAELLTRAFPVLYVLTLAGILLPLVLGTEKFYVWAAHDVESWKALGQPETWYHHVHGKHAYLNPIFFAVRVTAYFAAWFLLSRYYYKRSVAQDESGDPKLTDQMRVWAGPGLIIYAFATAFAGIDLLMTLAPTWYSTMFGVYFWAGSAIMVMAALALIPLGLQKLGKIQTSINVEHYHDVGKLLFAFLFFWGYVAFSQFMLIWYADIPEETTWYLRRMFTNWEYLAWAILFGHFIVPFTLLLSRWTKRKTHLLALLASWLVLMHLLDLYFIIMPEYSMPDPDVSYMTGFKWSARAIAMDIGAVVGIAGLCIAWIAMAARKTRLIPVKDPDLGKSLAFENF